MKGDSKKGASIILPIVSFSAETKLCLKSLKENSVLENELIVVIDPCTNCSIKKLIEFLKKENIHYLINPKRLGPYKSWNKGAAVSNRDILCFVTSDQYFAPAWDYGLISFLKPTLILTSQLVEPGVLVPSPGVIWKDFGENAKNFKEEKFLKFVKEKKQRRLKKGGFFIPLLLFKKEFFRIGKFPTFGEFGTAKTVPNDIIFIEKAEKMGYKFKTSLESFSYHFQASSWLVKRRKIRKIKNKVLYKYLPCIIQAVTKKRGR